MNVLRASKHQGHSIFKGNGRQCVANSVQAIIQNYSCPPKFWEVSTLDTVLSNGDQLYEKIAIDESYLSYLDIPESVVTLSESLHGTLNCDTELPFYSLNDAIKELMENHVIAGCLLTMGHSVPSYTSAILKNDYYYYFFDSHSRNDVGMLAADGCACLTKHHDIFSLCNFIRHLAASLKLSGSVPFEMATVKLPVKAQDKIVEWCSDSESESSFSLFDPVSDGEYSCQLLMRDEIIKQALHDYNYSDVSDVEISSINDSSSSDEKEVDNEITGNINMMNDSATFLNVIDCNVFDENFNDFDNEVYFAEKIVGDSDVTGDRYDNDVDISVEAVDDVGDDYDDDDYQPSDDISSCSSDDVPLANLIKKSNPLGTVHSKDIPAPTSSPSHTQTSSVATSQESPSESEKEPMPDSEVSRSRKRKREPVKWKRNIAKLRKNSGQSYVAFKGKQKPGRVMQRGCGSGCRFKCSDNFNETEREGIFHSFWKLSCINKQRQFLASHAVKQPKKTNSSTFSRRTSSIKWYMPSSDQENIKVRVCKTFFLKTLGISDKMIQTVHKKINSLGLCDDDARGKHLNRANQTPDEKLEQVRVHIKSFSAVESHYCRSDTKRLYLSPGLTTSKMYQLYKAKCWSDGSEPVSEYIYRKVFDTEFNLSFHHPKKDQCDLCKQYENASNEEKEKLDETFQKHLKNKSLSREQKEADKNRVKGEKNSDTLVCSFDLEQILLSPHSFQSCLFYKRRLNSLNFTIYDLASSDGFCYLWNESLAKRGACEVASCLYQFISSKSKAGAKNFIFYSDNCVSQNKNRFYVTMLWYCMSKYKLTSVVHRYLEKGHTQNEGDSIHSSVESASRNIPVYTTGQWATVIRSARHRRPYIVMEMTPKDFFDFKHLATDIKNFEVNTDGQKVQWNSIKVLKFHCSAPNQFQYQNDHDGPVFTVDLFYRTRFCIPDPCSIKLKQLRDELVPIPKAKYMDLLSLCRTNIIPRVHHMFYVLLPYEN